MLGKGLCVTSGFDAGMSGRMSRGLSRAMMDWYTEERVCEDWSSPSLEVLVESDTGLHCCTKSKKTWWPHKPSFKRKQESAAT